jgi:hypothetical protein
MFQVRRNSVMKKVMDKLQTLSDKMCYTNLPPAMSLERKAKINIFIHQIFIPVMLGPPSLLIRGKKPSKFACEATY